MFELRALLARSRRGDEGAMPRLREVLDAHPEVTRWLGDLAGHAEAAWIDLACGPDPGVAEALRRRLAALKAELAGPTPSPIERLLVERVAACWLQASCADAAAARARDVSVGQAELASRRQGAAHRRYLSALATLATVRRLLPAPVERPDLAGSRSRPIGSSRAPGRGAAGGDPVRTEDAPLVAFAAGGDRDLADRCRAAARSAAHSRAV